MVGLTDESEWRVRSRRVEKTDASESRPKSAPPFASVYESFANPILRYCQVRIDNPAEAEDAAALIFTKALQAYPPDNPENVRSWLFAIAHNVVANHYRTASARAPARPLDDAGLRPHALQVAGLLTTILWPLMFGRG